MNDSSLRAVILAAGRGVRRLDVGESTPAPLVRTPEGRAILDEQIESLRAAGVDDVACLAGYHIEKLVEAHSHINYYYDPEWQEDGHVAGLAKYPGLVEGGTLLTTGDTMFDAEAVDRLRSPDAEMTIAVNRFTSSETAWEATRALPDSELVALNDDRLEMTVPEDRAPDARVLGLAFLSPRGVQRFQSVLADAVSQGLRQDDQLTFADLLAAFLDAGGDVRGVSLGEHVRAHDETHALAKFLLGTKADTLARFDGRLMAAQVPEQVVFTAKTWDEQSAEVVDRIRSRFETGSVVVRSSAVAEDGWQDSQAGAFYTELDVDPTDERALRTAIEAVVESLREGSGHLGRDQVLVQPQVEDVAMSGVAFTRDLDSGGPYTVINYDDNSGRTDTVTAGQGATQRTVYFHHDVDGAGRFDDVALAAVKRAIDELRDLLDDPPLDIEFAVNNDGDVTILQVRPLAVHTGSDRFARQDVDDEVDSVLASVSGLQSEHPFLFGDRTVLGVMPDWNPAEMIGTEPDPLAVSLYRYLITDDIWARARAEAGYRDVRPTPLMVTLAGKPYIDTRADFNSFLPASLPDELGRQLVGHYLDRLAAHPDLQDKVEFEIAFTCLDFSFDDRASRLAAAGFSEEEIETIRDHLRRLTDDIVSGEVAPIETQRERLERLGRRRRRVLKTEPTTWRETVTAVDHLLADTRDFGTLPFSILARDAFIATAFLRSLVEQGVLTPAERETIAEGVPTVAQRLATDLERVRAGEADAIQFLEQYGHLRPGTYDVRSPRYDADPEGYFDLDVDVDPVALDGRRESALADWSPTVSEAAQAVFDDVHADIQTHIDRAGLTFSADDVFEFITHSIPLREVAKFEFTRNLSAALTLLERGGSRALNLSAADLAHLEIGDLLDGSTENVSPVVDRELERAINHSEKRARIQEQVQLPPVIRDCEEVLSFEVVSEQPNYITSGRTTAPVMRVGERDDVGLADLDGQIVVIPAADPGYDWVFGADIAGLVTKYGGVASHMAIRAAEFGIPAAIGCGDVLYDEIANADLLELDCDAGQLREVR